MGLFNREKRAAGTGAQTKKRTGAAPLRADPKLEECSECGGLLYREESRRRGMCWYWCEWCGYKSEEFSARRGPG